MIQYQAIDGVLLRDMAMAGSALLEKHREAVDALNVFPVPDGDTGTNMSLTMQSAVREVNSREFLRADEAAAALAKGALRGARGNSGVITSQLLRGFSKAIAGMERVTPVQFAQALKAGADMAYKAVMKPKEGTILTVARVIAEDALKQVRETPDSYDALFDVMLRSGEAILKRTPEMLPPLKQAGVVDSGGSGLLYIYKGYAAILRGETIEEMLAQAAAEEGAFADDHDAIREFTHAYHVRFVIRNMKDDCTEGDIDSFRRRLNRIGDRVSVEGDLSEVRVHVHTNAPGSAIEFGLELGDAMDFEVENMAETRRRKEAAEQPAEEEEPAADETPAKAFGMVAVSLGDGFSKIFRDLGVDCIVEGGQTMNPSTADILAAIESANADKVIVLPDNGNIRMAAEAAAAACESCEAAVVPTKSVLQAFSAMFVVDTDGSLEDNVDEMNDAIAGVRDGEVTTAVRDSQAADGSPIHAGDVMGIEGGAITVVGSDVADVTVRVINRMQEDEEGDTLTILAGADLSEDAFEELLAAIEEAQPDLEIDSHRGEQPLYPVVFSIE